MQHDRTGNIRADSVADNARAKVYGEDLGNFALYAYARHQAYVSFVKAIHERNTRVYLAYRQLPLVCKNRVRADGSIDHDCIVADNEVWIRVKPPITFISQLAQPFVLKADQRALDIINRRASPIGKAFIRLLTHHKLRIRNSSNPASEENEYSWIELFSPL